MFPSPGPRWEALQEPAATDSSQDELDFDGEEDDELSIVPKETAATSGQPLKRKDGGWDIGTAPKRLKLKEPDINDRLGSVSAPVPKVQPTTSNLSSSVAGPSKISNPGTSISARASTSSSMAPPADALPRIFGKNSLAFTSKPASRPLTSEQKASASTSSRSPTSAGFSSQRIKPSHRPSSSLSSNKLPAPPAKPKPSENEIIEISSDSGNDSPPPPKRQIKPKTSIPSQARKFTGGHQPRRSSPPKRKNDPEIIEIFDSDDEVVNPHFAAGKSVVSGNELPKKAQVSGNTSTSNPPPDDGMDIDQSFDGLVEVDAPSKGIDIDHPMRPDRDRNTSAALRWTPSPPHKPEPVTPAHPSLQPQAGPSSIKKPNRQGFNPISIPDDITLRPSPTKRHLQTAVKTTSGSFKQREISPTSSSASSPTGDSESGKESSNPNSRDSTSDPGPDLRNLTDALGIDSTGNSSPEPQVLTKKSPTPPKATTSLGPLKAGGAATKYVARKSAGKSFSPTLPLATKPPLPPNAGGPATKPAARKSSGNVQSLAEAIMKSGQSNAMNAKMYIKRSSKGKSAASLDPTRVVSPATAESSKALVNLFSTLKSKPSTPVASTSKVLPPPLSRSVTDDELQLMPPEPLPSLPPPSPSPPPSKSPLALAGSASEPTSVLPETHLNAKQKSASPLTMNALSQPTKPPIPPSTLIWKTGVPFKSKSASKPPTRTSSLSSLPTIAHAESVAVPEKSTEDSQLLPMQSVDQPPISASSPPRSPILQQSPVLTRDSPLPSTSKPTISPSFDAASPPDKISDPKSVSETRDKQPAVQAEVTTFVVEQSTTSSIEASNDAPAVPDVEMSWNPPLDDDMANDTDECQALIEDHDDDDIMEVEHMSHDIPSGKVTSPAQSDSNDWNEAGPSRRSSSPSIELRRSRRSSRSSTEHWPATFDDDDNERPRVYESASRNTTPEDSGAVVHKGKTYGGLPAITWKEYRRNLNNFVQKCYYAKDLPHALQDHVNDMSPYTQMMAGMRDLFQAMVLENTVEDEPDAPPIELQNSVDEEPTPPWEFYYTNKMWHGEGVPPPDVKNLISCSCKGVCDPRSKTCACLMNQRKVAADPHLEFAYDKAGRLKIPGYPVFECNDLCGCGDECRNRVVQHGRKVQVSIRKTEHKGWGVFAGNKKIPMGTFIGIYSGELLTDTVAHERGVLYNTYGRTYLFDLDFHHLKPDENDENYHDWSNKYTVDAYHAGNFTRFLNNSCDPNCRLYPCYINEGNIDKPLLAIFSRRDIEPNEEICFNYQGRYPGDEGDDDEEDDGSNADDESQSGARDRIYEKCMCGAAKCTGVMFR